jgi:hypothetical protein
VTLTDRGDGLWGGSYTPAAAGALTVSATAGAETRTVAGTAVADYWQSTVPMAWIDARAGGTRLTMADDTEASVALPFTFQFYNEPFSTVKVSSNGFVVFGASPAIDYWNEAIPSTLNPNGFAAPLWDDLNAGVAGAEVWHRTVGSAPNRRFVVSWIDVPHYGGTDGVTFQLVLEEGTNSILYQYSDVYFAEPIYDNGGSATVGLENGTGTAGKQLSYNTPVLGEYVAGTAVRYSIGSAAPPPPPDTTPPAVPNALVASAGLRFVTLDWADNTEPDLAGYRVYRRSGGGAWAQIASVTGSTFTNTGLTGGTAYSYYVTAYDGVGNESAASATVTATPWSSRAYQPNGYTIEQGTLTSGSLSSLYSNDSVRLHITRTGTIASFYARTMIAVAERATLRKLTISYNGYASSTSASMTLAVWNWSSSSWQNVDGPRAATTGDRSFTWTNTSAPRNYVSSAGEIRYRVRGELPSGTSFNTRTDQIRYTIEY